MSSPPRDPGHAPRPPASDDAALVMRVLGGDGSAFGSLVERYGGLVSSIAYRLLGDLERARDASQETFLKAFRHLATLEDPSKFRPWVAYIARTTCIDVLRKQKLDTVCIDELVSAGVPAASPPPPSTPGSSEHEELYEKALATLRSLPRIYQEAMLLKHLRGMSYKEMAAVLGVSAATVESRLYRARLLLKERMGSLYEDLTT